MELALCGSHLPGDHSLRLLLFHPSTLMPDIGFLNFKEFTSGKASLFTSYTSMAGSRGFIFFNLKDKLFYFSSNTYNRELYWRIGSGYLG